MPNCASWSLVLTSQKSEKSHAVMSEIIATANVHTCTRTTCELAASTRTSLHFSVHSSRRSKNQVGATASSVSLAIVIELQPTEHLGRWRPSPHCHIASCAVAVGCRHTFVMNRAMVFAGVLAHITHASDAMSVASVNVQSASPRSLRPPALIRLRTGATRPAGWLAGSLCVT